MKKKVMVVLILALAGVGAWFFRDTIQETFSMNDPKNKELILYGNVDNRQVALSFALPERIRELYPEEGTIVRRGELLGALESVRIENEIAAVKANIRIRQAALSAAQAGLKKMQNGTRVEYIAIARAGLSAMNARYEAAATENKRSAQLYKSDIMTKREQEKSEAEYLFYKGATQVIQGLLSRLIKGEREEDIEMQQANVSRAKAELARAVSELKILEQKLADTRLYAPRDGIIRSRIHEPGEMVSPQAPVLTMSIISPKWIRTYIRESDLMKVRTGDKAAVHFDGTAENVEGRIGYISSAAEFTPKNIETAELRTNLVYEMRVYVDDEKNQLKLGAPATITFPEKLAQ